MKKYFIRLIDSIRKLFDRKPQRTDIRLAAYRDYEYNRRRAKNRAEVDRLLDKISRYGKESLTKNERKFLNNTHEF
ncbi:MAG: hypothetical protein LBL90_02480 [Prevotellaceae bacterium]|jgi:hypothetical protein|nr:hypothetical protein [Prevotellaceae bacterium]